MDKLNRKKPFYQKIIETTISIKERVNIKKSKKNKVHFQIYYLEKKYELKMSKYKQKK